MGRVYGYCRISTKEQNIDRQVNNIKSNFSDAVMIREVFTGKREDRPEWIKLKKKIKEGDIIIFDEVSRMSRNASEGFQTYKEMLDKGVELIFLKEQHINTSSYKKAVEKAMNNNNTNINSGNSSTDNLINGIINVINEFMLNKVEDDIRLAFERAENEIKFLSDRTKEGIEIARLNGKRIGLPKGSKLVTKKSLEMKEKIRKYNRSFGGTLNNADCIRLLHITPNTFYKYKKELLQEEI